jgi:hypothetical protein
MFALRILYQTVTIFGWVYIPNTHLTGKPAFFCHQKNGSATFVCANVEGIDTHQNTIIERSTREQWKAVCLPAAMGASQVDIEKHNAVPCGYRRFWLMLLVCWGLMVSHEESSTNRSGDGNQPEWSPARRGVWTEQKLLIVHGGEETTHKKHASVRSNPKKYTCL